MYYIVYTNSVLLQIVIILLTSIDILSLYLKGLFKGIELHTASNTQVAGMKYTSREACQHTALGSYKMVETLMARKVQTKIVL